MRVVKSVAVAVIVNGRKRARWVERGFFLALQRKQASEGGCFFSSPTKTFAKTRRKTRSHTHRRREKTTNRDEHKRRTRTEVACDELEASTQVRTTPGIPKMERAASGFRFKPIVSGASKTLANAILQMQQNSCNLKLII